MAIAQLSHILPADGEQQRRSALLLRATEPSVRRLLTTVKAARARRD
jgi:hypothetical protein